MSLVGALRGMEALHQYQNDHFHLRHQSDVRGDTDKERQRYYLYFPLGK